MNIASLCEKLATSLASTDIPIERYALVTRYLGDYFGADADEIPLPP